MYAIGMRVVAMPWSSSGSEEFVGDQEFFDQEIFDQQDFENQGKYSMGLSLLSYSL